MDLVVDTFQSFQIPGAAVAAPTTAAGVGLKSEFKQNICIAKHRIRFKQLKCIKIVKTRFLNADIMQLQMQS